MTRTVLLIDDCPDFRATLTDILLDEDFDLREAACPHDAFEILRDERVDLIICDLHMPFIEGDRAADFEQSPVVGIKTIQELIWVFPGMPVVAISAAPASDLTRYARALGNVPLLAKPISKSRLLEVISASFAPPQAENHLQ